MRGGVLLWRKVIFSRRQAEVVRRISAALKGGGFGAK
ncbi:TPA_asm: hypothetical protein [Porphyromonas phage phage028a_KCOM2799]|uniref:Uncharacterized protein n=1 Tax=Porphyromonas phage phage028a_KCOM2799 TaxID=3154118 RepID=A0AAT9JG04_9CAUD